MQKLQDLHPQRGLPGASTAPSAATSMTFAKEDVLKAALSFPKGSSAGPSGLRPAHIREALQCGTSAVEDDLLIALTEFCNVCASGSIPRDVAPFMLAANLLPFRKEGGSIENPAVRPIASGETLRRVVGKVIMNQVKHPFLNVVSPLQCGVGVADAVQAVSVTLRRSYDILASKPDWGLAQIDIANAFNSIHREPIMNFIKQHLPTMCGWVEWMLTAPANLYCRGDKFCCTTGVQQGDPLGPLLFSAGIHAVISSCNSHFPEVWGCWYLDDGSLVGPLEALERLVTFLLSRLEEIGLKINFSKCHLLTVGEVTLFPLLATMKVHGIADNDGLRVLGTPVGGKQFTEEFLENNIIHQVETFCRAVEALDNVQVGITLLKHCTGFCKVVHLMRILPPATFGDLPSVVDEVVLQTFQHISGIVTSPLMVAQIRLPVSLGGFGITSCEIMAPTLYVSGILAYQMNGMALIGTPIWISCLPMDLTGALQTISTFPELRPIVDLISQPVLTLETLKYKDHKEWSNLIYKHQFQQLVTSSTARDRARLVCLHNHSSGAWLEVCPSTQLGLRLSNAEMRVLIKWRLGAHLLQPELQHQCPLCGGSMDCYGDHLVGCPRNGVIRRHGSLLNLISKYAGQAGMPHVVDKGYTSDSRQRPGDITFTQWNGGDRLYVDLTVRHPLSLSYDWSRVKQGTECLEEATREKEAKYSPLMSLEEFMVFGMTTFGGLNEGAEAILLEIGRAYVSAAPSEEEAEEDQCHLTQQLLMVLNREVARMLRSGVPL